MTNFNLMEKDNSDKSEPNQDQVANASSTQNDDSNSKEITNYLLDQNLESTTSFAVLAQEHCSRSQAYAESMHGRIPFILISRNSSAEPITTQPRSNQGYQTPQSLFLQALAKLNDSSINLALLRRLQNQYMPPAPELTPPDSLLSAPPSYSFVLRQTAVRRRPRLMGTFIPSPSFVQHTPPPHYASAFDVYVENPIPRPPVRVVPFGFTSMLAVCPECGFTGMTLALSKVTLCTHVCAAVLCLMCCWLCVPLPYVTKSCKDVYHYCRNCRRLIGMYSPSSPANPYA